jgi:hydroxymethylbilane synthase
VNDAAPRLRIATRKSPLALWQAEHVAELLRRAHPGLDVDLVPLSTKGDRIQDRSLAAIGGKGLFIKELEAALDEQRADIAVHSMKDVPGDLPDGLLICAVLARADPRDAFVSANASCLDNLPHGARVGTSSLRRQAQLLAIRPDLKIEPLRGNVDTRVRRLDVGELDAIILACAGLIRLGWESRITARLEPGVCLPAVAQGIIGVECRAADAQTRALLQPLNDQPTRVVMDAERAFAARLGGSCQSPIAAYATLENDRISLAGLVAEPDGSRLLRDSLIGTADEPQRLGERLADRVLGAGADTLLERLRGVVVLVTRPESQAASLCRLLHDAGATVVKLPAMTIKPTGDKPASLARWGPADDWDLIVFTSANAVRFGSQLLAGKHNVPLAAIGPATAGALERAGFHGALMPDRSDSESLLQQPALMNCAGRRVLIIKGRHGRALLHEKLAQRGAHVVIAEVYTREPANPSAAELAAVETEFTAAASRVITATSVEIAVNLLQLAPPALRREFDGAVWLVPSGRVAAALRERGLPGPFLQADSAEDHDLLAAIVRWRSSVSGA